MGHCNFEPAIKIDCIMEVLKIVRAGEAGEGQIAEAIEHGACAAGCAAALYRDNRDPDEDNPPIFSASPNFNDKSLEECCDEIEQACTLKGETEISPDEWIQIGLMIWNLICKWRGWC